MDYLRSFHSAYSGPFRPPIPGEIDQWFRCYSDHFLWNFGTGGRNPGMLLNTSKHRAWASLDNFLQFLLL